MKKEFNEKEMEIIERWLNGEIRDIKRGIGETIGGMMMDRFLDDEKKEFVELLFKQMYIYKDMLWEIEVNRRLNDLPARAIEDVYEE